MISRTAIGRKTLIEFARDPLVPKVSYQCTICFLVVIYCLLCIWELYGRGASIWLSGCSVPAIKSLFSNTFLKNCDTGDCLSTTTCPMTVVGGRQGHAPCGILLLEQSLFLCQWNFQEVI